MPPQPPSDYLQRQYANGPITMPRPSLLLLHVGHELRSVDLDTTIVTIAQEMTAAPEQPTGKLLATVDLTPTPTTFYICVTCGAFMVDFQNVPAADLQALLDDAFANPSGASANATRFSEIEPAAAAAEPGPGGTN